MEKGGGSGSGVVIDVILAVIAVHIINRNNSCDNRSCCFPVELIKKIKNTEISKKALCYIM